MTATPPETTQPPEAEPPETTQAPETTEAPVEESGGIPTGVWVLLGVGMGAIGIGVFIGSRRSGDE